MKSKVLQLHFKKGKNGEHTHTHAHERCSTWRRWGVFNNWVAFQGAELLLPVTSLSSYPAVSPHKLCKLHFRVFGQHFRVRHKPELLSYQYLAEIVRAYAAWFKLISPVRFGYIRPGHAAEEGRRLWAAGRRETEQETAGGEVEAAAVDGMEDTGEMRAKMVSSDSAYSSSAVDTDTEDRHTLTAVTVPYNQDITHKVRTEVNLRREYRTISHKSLRWQLLAAFPL